MAAVLELPRTETPAMESVLGSRALFVPSADILPVDKLYELVVRRDVEIELQKVDQYWTRHVTGTFLRLLAALNLWQTGQYDYILVSGGHTHPPSIETRPAAQTMAEWLIEEKHLPTNVVLVEDQALDTYQNVELSIQRLETEGVTNPRITSVSHRTQNKRIRLTFQAYGFEIETFNVPYPIGLRDELRERLFYLIHKVDPKGEGRVTGWFGRYNRRNRARAATGT